MVQKETATAGRRGERLLLSSRYTLGGKNGRLRARGTKKPRCHSKGRARTPSNLGQENKKTCRGERRVRNQNMRQNKHEHEDMNITNVSEQDLHTLHLGEVR